MSFPSDLLICDPHFHVWDNSVTKNKNLGGIADGPLCTYLSRHYCASAAPLEAGAFNGRKPVAKMQRPLENPG